MPSFPSAFLLGELDGFALVSFLTAEGQSRLVRVSPEGRVEPIALPPQASASFSGGQLYAFTNALDVPEGSEQGQWRPGLWRLAPGAEPRRLVDGTGWASSFTQLLVTPEGLAVAGSDYGARAAVWLVDAATGQHRLIHSGDFNTDYLHHVAGHLVLVESYSGYESEDPKQNPLPRVLSYRLRDGALFFLGELPAGAGPGVLACGEEVVLLIPAADGLAGYRVALP